MKIILLCRLFYPHIGGVEKHVFEVSTELIKQGHQVVIITEQIEKKQQTILPKQIQNQIRNLEIYTIPKREDNWFKKFHMWKWMWDHKDLIYSADIIHCHDVFFWYIPFAVINPMKNVYTTFHGYETHFPPQKKAVIIRKISEFMSNKTICVGDYIKKWYGAKPTTVIFGGVKPSDAKIRVHNKKEKIKILFIGRIEEDTGVYIYNEVLNILSRNKIEFQFQAMGDGSLKKLFEKWGEVHSTFEAEKFIAESDIVFASSYLSILEAFAKRKPVFATYQNELKKDYLLMTPFKNWYTAEQDPMKLTHAVMKYINNPESMHKKIDDAFTWSQQQTWENITHIYLNLWKTK